MKIKTFEIIAFLIIVCIQAQAHSQDRVTLNIKNGTLETVLKEIRKQTGYLYALQDQWKEIAKRIDVNVINASLQDALNICFKDQPFTYTIIGKTIVVKEKEAPANIDIHGRVLDESKQPVPGVTVMLNGTKRFATTDDNGEFSFKKTDPEAVLVLTSINMQTSEVKVNGQTDLTIVMHFKPKELGEVSVEVNTGYQKLPKDRATGSFSEIDNKTFNLQPGPTVIDRLDGVVTGILFQGKDDASSNYTIRGVTSILGPSNPLVVVDNFPYEGDINNINPNDVESVSILKDAAASSIWGTRAGNGVIVITTKRAHQNQPLTVDFNANIQLFKKPDLFYAPQISSGDFINMEQFLFGNGYYDAALSSPYYQAVSPVVEILDSVRNGLLLNSTANAEIDAFRNHDARNDYNKYIYKNGVNQQYALSLKGGSSNSSHLFSLGYDKDVTSLAAVNRRINAQMRNEYKVNSRVLINIDARYSNTRTVNGKPGFNSIHVNETEVIPYMELADNKGNPLPVALDWRPGFTDTAGGGQLLNWKYYPLTDWKDNSTTTQLNDLVGNLGIELRLFKGVTAEIKYQYERQTSETNNYEDINSYAARNNINYFSTIDPNTGNVINSLPVGGIMNLYNTTLVGNSGRVQINYGHRWGRHNIVGVAGGEIRELHTTGTYNTIYGYNSDGLQIPNIDFVNAYPTYFGFDDYILNNLALSDNLNRYVSGYGNLAYTYNDKYTLSLSGRKDAANVFGVGTNDKWNPFWSVGGSWDVAKENFFHFSPFPFLRVRTTYGTSGNVDPGKAALTTLLYNGSAAYTNLPYSTITGIANPQLRWENVSTLNAGIDFATVKNRLSGSIEYYSKTGTDLYGAIPIDYTVGVGRSTLTENAASMKGSGIEMSLTSKILNGGLKWQVNLIFNYYTNKVTNYYRPPGSADENYVSDGNVKAAMKGKPLYPVVSYKWGGLDSAGNPQGYLNGKLSEDYTGIALATSGGADLVYNGPSVPVYFGAVMNTVSWKGFSLSANIKYELGYYFRMPALNYSNLFAGTIIGSGEFSNRWQKAGDEKITNVPSMVYPSVDFRDQIYTRSTVTVRRADNIRLQFINLGYLFPNPLLKKYSIRDLEIFGNAANLGILWKATKGNIDPDYGVNLPPQKSFTIGIRGSF